MWSEDDDTPWTAELLLLVIGFNIALCIIVATWAVCHYKP